MAEAVSAGICRTSPPRRRIAILLFGPYTPLCLAAVSERLRRQSDVAGVYPASKDVDEDAEMAVLSQSQRFNTEDVTSQPNHPAIGYSRINRARNEMPVLARRPYS